MNDLKVMVQYNPGVIKFENFDEIKSALTEQMEIYKNLDVTEDTVKESKKDIATLRKIRKAVDDRRKEIKAAYMDPYNGLDRQVKELTALIDEPISIISAKNDVFEQKRIEEKRVHIKNLWDENIKIPGTDISVFYNPSWENVTTTDASIKSDISQLNVNYESGVQTLKAFEDVGEAEIEQAIKVFVSNKLDLSKAVIEIHHFREHKKMMEEQAKRDAEREAERARIEEERKLAQEKANAEREAELLQKQQEKTSQECVHDVEIPDFEPEPETVANTETHLLSITATVDQLQQIYELIARLGVKYEEI